MEFCGGGSLQDIYNGKILNFPPYPNNFGVVILPKATVLSLLAKLFFEGLYLCNGNSLNYEIWSLNLVCQKNTTLIYLRQNDIPLKQIY